MSDVVIHAERLGKSYRIGHQVRSERYTALRDVVTRAAKGAARSARDLIQGRQFVAGEEVEDFWALQDLNFEIKRGEVVGVLGRNGAGKSTLLKILSRITEPSTGRVEIRGRVASLLEVGTGFHPELSGRENIYLNGAVLGMTRAEIRRKFDEIVAFAEVEKFLDTPVKRYSSGMYVRLAFAVAAHLEPEILVVDEVLAVGDAEFQKKCLGKLGEVAGHGRTVLFVSHNLAALRRICEVGIVLSGGRIRMHSNLQDCIDNYSSALVGADTKGQLYFPPVNRDKYHVISITMLNEQLLPVSQLATWRPAVFEIRIYAPKRTLNAAATFQISTGDGFLVTLCVTMPDHGFALNFEKGENILFLRFKSIMLSAGRYVIGAGLAIANTEWLYNEPQGAFVDVTPSDVYGAGFSPIAARYPVPMECSWSRPEPKEAES